VFVTVVVMAPLVVPTSWLPKFTVEDGVIVIAAPAAVPVPVSVIVCGEPVALSVTDTAALNVVADAGVKVTLMVQLRPAEILESPWHAPAGFSREKSAVFAPVSATLPITSAEFPEFVIVVTIAPLVVPTG
jgi:hypothetical protein